MKKAFYVFLNLNLILGHTAFAGNIRSIVVGSETYSFVNEKDEGIAQVTCVINLVNSVNKDLNEFKTDGKIVVDALELRPNKTLTLIFTEREEYDINLNKVGCEIEQ